jgi:hypothetical protein
MYQDAKIQYMLNALLVTTRWRAFRCQVEGMTSSCGNLTSSVLKCREQGIWISYAVENSLEDIVP